MGSLVSLVMSDIVDSTRRWNAAEGAMAADLELHDQLIREVVKGAGGSVFKHTGDGMIAVFDDPVAAAGAAAGIQQAIGGAEWQQPDGLRVRVATHTGVVYPRDGDLFGTAVNKVARLLGVCPPGAVLVSGATTALLADRAPEGLALQPVGPVALAGFATPDDAHALVGAGLARVVGVGAASAGPRIEVPSIDDELVGRSEELAAIWEALSRARLVTLVGVGGMGKTRLALEVAAGAVAAFDGAVWWIDLSNATTSDAVIPVAMAAVEARELPGRTHLQALCDRFAGVRGVVVVDNCEHVLGAARELVGALRSGVPEVRVVATSREALGLRGEQIVPIGSLPGSDGVRLFTERALAVRPELDFDANRVAIERICIRLDGIPLAIELAAARCRSMNPTEIDTRLDDRFRLLRGGRDGAERHRTLQAAVAWSYSLLEPDERAAFDRMAVFAGGTLIDGLTAVTGLDELDLLDIVDRLVARSMVVATDTPLGTRYHQLETLRQYAEDRLVEAGAISDARDRHLDWVRDLATWIAASRGTSRSGTSWRRFAVEVDNLRVAVAHATGSGRRTVAQGIVAAIAFHAVERPAWEAADWIRPLHLDGDWTTDAAVCAAMAAQIDLMGSGRPCTTYPIGGVPEHFVLSNPLILYYQYVDLMIGGRLDAASDLVERAAALGRNEQMVATLRLLGIWSRVVWLGAEHLTADQWSEIDARCGESIARTRANGDEEGTVLDLVFAALLLAYHAPRRALAYARECADLARQLGALYMVNRVEGAEAQAQWTLLGELHGREAAEALGSLRDQIAARADEHQWFLGTTLLMFAASVLVDHDPTTSALTVAVAGQRNLLATRVLTQLRANPHFVESQARDAAVEATIDEVAGRVLIALDRLIAQQSGGGG